MNSAIGLLVINRADGQRATWRQHLFPDNNGFYSDVAYQAEERTLSNLGKNLFTVKVAVVKQLLEEMFFVRAFPMMKTPKVYITSELRKIV